MTGPVATPRPTLESTDPGTAGRVTDQESVMKKHPKKVKTIRVKTGMKAGIIIQHIAE